MKTLILTVASLAFVLAGCSYTKPPIQGLSDPYHPSQVMYGSSDLRDDTRVENLRVDRDDARILLVTVPVRNVTNDTFSVDWRITFLDRNGRPVSNTGWAAKTLNANAVEYFTANSLTADAWDWQMDFRYSK